MSTPAERAIYDYGPIQDSAVPPPAKSATFEPDSIEDELRRARTNALSLSIDIARDRTGACGTHPGADAILATAARFCDFIWNGAER